MKIDVCLVTKKKLETIKGIENIPLNSLIIETSEPLAMARMRAIQKVTTEWFAFIDDDVEILADWFKEIKVHIDDDVGAVQGIMMEQGLGEKWDRDINEWKKQKYDKVYSLKMGDRGFTHNTLIRTELVKDWKPTIGDLSAFEDYELTQHILRKGFKWVVVPNFGAKHLKTWKDIAYNSVWGMENWKKIANRKDVVRQLVRWLFQIVHTAFDPKISWRVKIYEIYFRIFCVYGVILS